MAKAQGSNAKAAAKKRVVKVDSHGDAHVTASFNNIIISLTNKAGQVISWSSAGKMGFRGSKKNTPYAAQMAAADAAKAAMEPASARWTSSSRAPVPDARVRYAPLPIRDWRSWSSTTSPRCPTTDAVLPRSAASNLFASSFLMGAGSSFMIF